MPRVHKVWKRKQDGWYYVKIAGSQVKLSPDKAEAERAMHALLAQEKEETPAETVTVLPTFRKVADLYLDNSVRENKPNTSRMHKMYLQSFCDKIGRRRVGDLKVHHVSEWVAGNDWGQSSACSARGTVLACLNWAVAQGYIAGHPLTKMKRGSHKRRERVFSADERQKIRDFVKPDFRDFLFALEQTGARPFSELAPLTAAMIDWKTSTVRLGEHKNEKKGKTRTIYLNPDMVALLKRLAETHPKGLLFRNTKGNLWTSHDATRRLHYATEKLGIPKGTVYAARHGFCTDALAKGISADIVAELAGNSPITLHRNYSHLHLKREAMLEAAKKAVA